MAEIGIPVLLILFVYVFYIFTKEYPPREKNIFLTYTKSGAKIPGMRTHRSKKRKR